MADALLSAPVGAAMCVVSAAAIGLSVTKIKKDELSEKKIPIMAVSGAFIFAAQMINFTIPGTGSSGHISGGILLAALLGGYPALLTISAVLIIQCLFFADGGLLALGCNIFNMGVIPCLIVYPLLFKPLLGKNFSAVSISLASIAAAIIGLQLGAFCVVLETRASGITELSFKTFTLLMQPVYLVIGIAEGVITAAVLNFIHKMRPEIMESANAGCAIGKTVPIRRVVTILVIITIMAGAGLSVFASAHPDGLEWAAAKITGSASLDSNDPIIKNAAAIQKGTAVMPDYSFKSSDEKASGTSVAGLIGGALTFVLAGGAAFVISSVKKKRRKHERI